MDTQEMSWIARKAERNARAQSLLEQVDALVEDIFEKRLEQSDFRFFRRFKPFFTRHHAKAIEDKLDELIYGIPIVDGEKVGEPKEAFARDFYPTSTECMYLVAAVRLRTLGLLWGLFSDERTERTQDDEDKLLYDCTAPKLAPWENGKSISCLRFQKFLDKFTERSAQFIAEEWIFNCNWSPTEKNTLEELIGGYHPKHRIEDLPEDVGGVRLEELACLLRLATSSVLVGGECPLELRLSLKPGGISEPRKTHLATLQFISQSSFDPRNNQLVIQALVPQREDIPDPRQNSSSLPVASIDYGWGVQFLGTVVQDVVNSVSPVLTKYPNTNIRQVRVDVRRRRARIASNGGQVLDNQLPYRWLILLASAPNGAEVAGMTAAILRSFCASGFSTPDGLAISFSDQVQQVCLVAEAMHPFNALALQLISDVRSKYDWSNEPDQPTIDKLKEHMDNYLVERATIGDEVADKAIEQGCLQNDDKSEVDIVVVSHYGRCVMSALIRNHFQGEVWMVEPSPGIEGRWVQGTSDRVFDVLGKAGIDVKSLPSVALYQRLTAIQEKKSIAYLTGAKGMWATGDEDTPDKFICSQGVFSAAMAVRGCGGRTFLLAESDKQFRDADDIMRVKNNLDEVQREADTRPWIQVEVLDVDLFTQVVTF